MIKDKNYDYYEKHYKEYHERTFSIDPSPFLIHLEKRLKPGALILDVGCSSGRDLLWFKNRGYKVIGFERSIGLAEIAKRNVNCKVIVGDFNIFDFSTLSVDAICLIGSLVHTPYNEFSSTLMRISRALNDNGKILITMKEGSNPSIDEYGRFFYLWQDNNLREIYSELGYEVLYFNKDKSILSTGEIWLEYVLARR